MDKKKYFQVKEENKISDFNFKNLILSFVSGGSLGLIYQGLFDLFNKILLLSEVYSNMLTNVIIISISAILTILGIYNDLVQIFSSGLFVPLTGFSNSMVSSCLDGKNEGLVCGIGSKAFTYSGGVIIYGVFFSFIFSTIYYFIYLLGGIR